MDLKESLAQYFKANADYFNIEIRLHVPYPSFANCGRLDRNDYSWVCLVSVNPEVVRLQLALSIANSRQDVPYPAFVETLLLLIVLELIHEASIRLPKSVGPTITMVRGIILGQAAVSGVSERCNCSRVQIPADHFIRHLWDVGAPCWHRGHLCLYGSSKKHGHSTCDLLRSYRDL